MSSMTLANEEMTHFLCNQCITLEKIDSLGTREECICKSLWDLFRGGVGGGVRDLTIFMFL